MERRDRARGALLGLACGDAVGTTLEFKTPGGSEPGKVLAGEYPGGLDAGKATRKLDLLVDAGIRTIVDLTAPADGLDPYIAQLDHLAEVRQLDLRRIGCAAPRRRRDRAGGLRATVREHRAELAEDRPVFVHCWDGVALALTDRLGYG